MAIVKRFKCYKGWMGGCGRVVGGTYVNDPVLGAVGVRATHIEAGSVSHWLDHSDVVPAVEQLQQNNSKSAT